MIVNLHELAKITTFPTSTMAHQSNRDDYMTSFEAREILCCSPPTLRNYAAKGLIKTRKLGVRRFLYERKSVMDFWKGASSDTTTTHADGTTKEKAVKANASA